MKPHLAISIGLLLFAACSKPAPLARQFDQLKLTYKKYDGQVVQRQIPIIYALVDADSDTRIDVDRSQHPFGNHWVCLGNYDVSEKSDKLPTDILKDLPPDQDLEPGKACV